MNYLIFECPHCGGGIQILKSEINCGIFRHAIIKSTGKQVNPHLSKIECEKLGNAVYGCSKPFKIENGVISKCDYSL